MATKDKLDALRLPELQARFKEVVGEATKSPNRKFLIRRIDETLAKKAQAKPRGRFKELSVEELRAKYVEVVGRPSGSSSKPYVELGDMWSWAPARRVLPRRAREATPHNRAAFSGGMTLRFPRPEACMATGAASWRSQGERA